MSDPHLNAADPHTSVHPPHAHHVHETSPMHDAVDQWHDHSHDERPQHAHTDVINTRLVLAVGLALAGVIVVAVVVVYGFYVHYNTQRSSERERTSAFGSPLTDTRIEKARDLSMLATGGSYQVSTGDENAKKTITIAPIGQAMDRVVRAYTRAPARK
ncbi:MAG TPA: hypothetical protein PKE29_10695 [Phycisphaerales bacterium]|nr:hypothetical protein [Phycisphaerales bacterium]